MPARHLAITMGDPAGIGPEIIVKAAARLRSRIESGDLRLVVIGSNPALEQARAQFTPEMTIPEVEEADADWPALCALQAGPEGEPVPPRPLSAGGGRLADLAGGRGGGGGRASRSGPACFRRMADASRISRSSAA